MGFVNKPPCGICMTKSPMKLVRFKDTFSRHETMINPDKVQLLEDATENSHPKVRIIFGPGQSMVVDGSLDEVARKLSE
jgi:hypothetical protein